MILQTGGEVNKEPCKLCTLSQTAHVASRERERCLAVTEAEWQSVQPTAKKTPVEASLSPP